MNDVTLSQVLEALLFAAPKPLTAKQLADLCAKGALAAGQSPAEAPADGAVETPILNPLSGTTEEQITEALAALSESYAGRGLWIQEVGGGFRLGTRPEAAPWVRRLFDEAKPAKLSQPAMETLAIIAYRQPISRADVEAVRGVAVDGVVATLLERRLIRLAGRSDTPGRALLYETTQEFLELFGLKSLEELPNAAELRHIPAPAPQPEPTPEPAAEEPAAPAPAEETPTPAETS